MDSATPDTGPIPRRDLLARAFVLASFAVFFVSIWRFVDRTAVDLPYWDQWDFLAPLFDGEGLWAAFRYQHAPHRQGLGALVFALTNALTGWNMRAPSFAIVLILLAGAILAVELKVALFGRLTVWDAMIPPLFFRLSQYEALTFIPNPSHSVIPVVLALLACRTLLVRSAATRLALAAGTVLIGFRFEELKSAPCRFDPPTLIDYVIWVITMMKASFGFLGRDELAIFAALVVLFLPTIGALARGIAGVARVSRDDESQVDFARAGTSAILIGISGIFCILSAWARICIGSIEALDSRYVTMMIPFALGLYFAVIWWSRARRTRGEIAVRSTLATVLFVLLTLSSFHGALHLSPADRSGVERAVELKRMWTDCVRAGGSVVDCDQRVRLKVHPAPAATRLDEKLAFLRERGLSFYATRE